MAADLLAEVYGKDMLNELTSDEIVDTVIRAYYKKYRFKMLYWWIKYGFKANKMYWYVKSK